MVRLSTTSALFFLEHSGEFREHCMRQKIKRQKKNNAEKSKGMNIKRQKIKRQKNERIENGQDVAINSVTNNRVRHFLISKVENQMACETRECLQRKQSFFQLVLMHSC